MKKLLIFCMLLFFLSSCKTPDQPLVSVGIQSWEQIDDNIKVKVLESKDISFMKTWRGLSDFPNDNKKFIYYKIEVDLEAECIEVGNLFLKSDINKYYNRINPDRIDGRHLKDICSNGIYDIYFEVPEDVISSSLVYQRIDMASKIIS